MLLCAALTALISVNGAVAALIPVVVVTAVRLHESPSRLLIPMAFAAHAGSMLALTGSPVNVIVSNAAKESGGDYFGFFEFTLAGVPLLVGTVAVVVLFGERLVAERSPRYISRDFSEHARTLLSHYELDNLPSPLYDRRAGVAEVVVPPRSGIVGDTVFPGMVTDSGDLLVLAVHRNGEDLGPGQAVLKPGDTLLLQGSWDALSTHLDDPDVLVVDSPQEVRRQAVPLGPGAKRALVVLVLMVALLATGSVPPAVAALLAAGALVLGRVVTLEQSYRAISWTTVVLVAGMIPLSTAMSVSGAADDLADGLVSIVGDSGPYPLLIGVCVLTAVLGQLISNTATTLVVIPIALAAAAELDVSDRPVLMALNVMAASGAADAGRHTGEHDGDGPRWVPLR